MLFLFIYSASINQVYVKFDSSLEDKSNPPTRRLFFICETVGCVAGVQGAIMHIYKVSVMRGYGCVCERHLFLPYDDNFYSYQLSSPDRSLCHLLQFQFGFCGTCLRKESVMLQ